MELRKEFGIPEEKTSEEEDKYFEAKRQAARKRAEIAGTEENYVKMFNRDPWTDRWLGPGPEPPDEFLDYSDKDIKKMSKKITDETEWKKKYVPEVTTIHLPKEAKESRQESERKIEGMFDDMINKLTNSNLPEEQKNQLLDMFIANKEKIMNVVRE